MTRVSDLSELTHLGCVLVVVYTCMLTLPNINQKFLKAPPRNVTLVNVNGTFHKPKHATKKCMFFFYVKKNYKFLANLMGHRNTNTDTWNVPVSN